MNSVGEIKVVAAGVNFDKNLPVKGTLIFELPNGKVIKLDILDILETDWYEDIA